MRQQAASEKGAAFLKSEVIHIRLSEQNADRYQEERNEYILFET